MLQNKPERKQFSGDDIQFSFVDWKFINVWT